MHRKKRLAHFIMGVSGVGKSTMGSLLSHRIDLTYFDGYDYDNERNIKKCLKVFPK